MLFLHKQHDSNPCSFAVFQQIKVHMIPLHLTVELLQPPTTIARLKKKVYNIDGNIWLNSLYYGHLEVPT